MKRLIFTAMFVAALFLPLLAQGGDITYTFTPQSIQVNSFNTASFDPITPQNQPILTRLAIHNNLNLPTYINLKLEIKWNAILLTSAEYISKEQIPANGDFPTLSNQDLITNSAGGYFNEIGSANIDFNTIVENSDILRRAVLSGFFPDGILQIAVQCKPANTSQAYGAPAIFTINVRNAGAINLVSPGAPAGAAPPTVNASPVNFFWSQVDTNFNDYYLVIREFPPNNPPVAANVENTGNLFYSSPSALPTNNFSEFLPFVHGNYYAWRVSTDIYTETNPIIERAQGQNRRLSSNWFVFRYLSNDQIPGNEINELQQVLSSLGNNQLNNLFNQGYTAGGTLYYEG
ncbi:MAG TPA: hypothetical protein P5533_08830, partial [Candidatus Cloacimonadota bacterium]|nr:hypothetical protein [Candidatus Cloacimonadota bacterium]